DDLTDVLGIFATINNNRDPRDAHQRTWWRSNLEGSAPRPAGQTAEEEGSSFSDRGTRYRTRPVFA
ncbi:MAG TPA: hypothetical protein DEP84_26050, partial [Chloroflexi bacterium]|nr:hypothetical protein [Chloroflexota bacterium]